MALTPQSRRRFTILLVVIALAAIAGRVYVANIRPNLIPKRFGVVDEGKVYRSGQLSTAAFHTLHERYGIRTVIDLGSTIHNDPVGERRNQRTADALGMKRYVFHLQGDSTGNANEYIQALRLAADPANQPVLVHCGAGTERTGLFCLLYKNQFQGVPLEEGFKEAQTFGHDPRRTPQMHEMMVKYAAPILEHLRTGGQINDGVVTPLPEPKPAAPLN